MASFMQLKGTTFDTFAIGKRGPVLTKIGDFGLDIDAIGSSSSVTAGNINIRGGENTSTGNGGTVSLIAGDSTGGSSTGGEVLLSGGNGISGGDVVVSGGFASTGNGGDITFVSGVSTGGGNPGAISFITLGPSGTSNGGDVSLSTGSTTATSGAAGDINITAGSGIAGAGGTGGDINITAGDTTGGNGGNINLKPGDGRNAINLLPAGTAVGDTAELRFRELAASGTNAVGFKSPDAIAADQIWVLPDSDGSDGQSLLTDGSGNLSWGNNSIYEVYASASQTVGTAATAVAYNTERFANADFTLAAGVVTINRAGLYSVTYTTSADSTNGTRDTVLSEVYVNGTVYPASGSYTYNRNVGTGEGSSTRTVLVQLAATNTVEVRVDRISGNGVDTIANQCGMIIERKGS